MLTSYLPLSFPRGIFPVGLPVKILKALYSLPTRITCLARPSGLLSS